MRKVFVEPVILPEPRFRDGLGVRYVRTDGTDDPVEVLRPLWDVGVMQNAIRQRVGRLATFRQARFVPVRAAETPRDDVSTIEVVSDFLPGYRLSQYLEASRDGTVSVETSAAIYVLRELLGALALLHESRGVSHGAVGPERILITPKGRVVVADYVLGPAIERLEYTRTRLWREFRIPLASGKGPAKLDDKADVVQVGLTALALLLGRPIDVAEYPAALEDLVAALNPAQKDAGRPPLPAALVGWVKRAALKESSGRFENVSDARMALESVISKADVASGGAGALKTLAEVFGQYAAAEEAKAAAAAAAEARRVALAAQAAAMDAIRTAAASLDAAGPAANAVPAFTLLSETPAASAEGAVDNGSAPVAESDPPVGWRVPEPLPVEETLPTSPLLQIDAPADVAPAEEFVEEVLDLTALAGSDDDLIGADELPVAEAAAAPPEEWQAPPASAAADTPVGDVEVIVDLRESEAEGVLAESAEPVSSPAEPVPALLEIAEVEAAAPAPAQAPSEQPAETVATIDAALAALAALGAPPPESPPDALPEWRLLADPVGATAPTIEVEEPTETIEELLAALEATAKAGDDSTASADTYLLVVDEPSLAMEPPEPALEPLAATAEDVPPIVEPAATAEDVPPIVEPAAMAEEAPPVVETVAFAEEAPPVVETPVAMVEACIPVLEAPAALAAADAAPSPEEGAPPEAAASVLHEILGLQEAQSAAQAAVEAKPEPPAEATGIAAWGFVEELVHHDARFETPRRADEIPPPRAAVEVVAPQAMAAEAGDSPVSEEPAPEAEYAAPPLPEDWLIEVCTSPPEPPPEPPTVPAFARALRTPAPPIERPRVAFTEAEPDAPASVPPVARTPKLPEPEADRSGPVFPRVAPSVQRVRAEARRRRLARIGNSISAGLLAVVNAVAGGIGAVVRGTGQAVSAAGRGTAGVVGAVLAGAVFAATALSRGIGGAFRATAAAAAAGARGVAAAGGAAARVTASVFRSAANGAAQLLRAFVSALAAAAGMTARAAAGAARVGSSAISASVRGLAAALAALGRAGSAAAVGTARGVAAASTSAGRAAGRVVAGTATVAAAAARQAGRGGAAAGRGMVRALAHAGSAASRAAARTGRGGAAAGRGIGHALSRAGSGVGAGGRLAGRGAAVTARGIGRAAVAVPRRLYFALSDLADLLPKPVFRPWYLAAALAVIVAVAGVPYAKARWFAVKPAVGTVRVESARTDAMVTIDGVAQGRAPVTASVPAGRHRIEIASGGRTRTHDIDVAADRETRVPAAGAEPKGMGSIRVATDPAGAEVFVDDVLHGRSPLTIDNVAVGTHTVLARDASGSVRQAVRVRADEAAVASLRIRPGWLAVFAPVKLDILENGRSIGSTERGRILSSPGPHTIEVVSEAVGFRETRQVDIKPGEATALTIQMPPVTIEVVAPQEAEILVDGQAVGQAPLGPVKVAVGTHEILMRHPTIGERRQVVSVTYNAPVRIVFE